MRKADMEARLRRFVVMLAVVFVVAGVAVIAQMTARLDNDAIALGAGVGLGCLGAIIPVGLILLSLRFVIRYLDERELRRSARQPQYGGYGQPPVIIVPGGYPQLQQPWGSRGDAQLVAGGPREFTVIGEE